MVNSNSVESFANPTTIKPKVDVSIEGTEMTTRLKVEKVMIKFLGKMEMIN